MNEANKSFPIFISYRRGATSATAGRIYDRIAQRFGPSAAFLDTEVIRGGEDFDASCVEIARSCFALVAIIGTDWLNDRLQAPTDLVHREIAAAIGGGASLFPIPVDGADFPRRDDLPQALASLLNGSGRKIEHSSFSADVQPLIEDLGRVLTARNAKPGNADSKEVASLTRAEWDLVIREESADFVHKRSEIQRDAEHRGLGGQTGSREAALVADHLESVARKVLERMETQESRTRVELQGETYWSQVEGALLPLAQQQLRSSLQSIASSARSKGLLSGGLEVGLLQTQGSAQSTLAHMIQTYTRSRALRHRLRR